MVQCFNFPTWPRIRPKLKYTLPYPPLTAEAKLATMAFFLSIFQTFIYRKEVCTWQHRTYYPAYRASQHVIVSPHLRLRRHKAGKALHR